MLRRLCLVVALCGACGGPRFYRYQFVPSNAAQARAEVAERAKNVGMTATRPPWTFDLYAMRPAPTPAATPGSAENPTRGVQESSSPQLRTVRVRAWQTPEGTLLEAAGDDDALLAALMPTSTRRYEDMSSSFFEPLPAELTYELGVAGGPDRDPSWRLDSTLRLGGLLSGQGGTREEPSLRRTISLLGGIGCSAQSRGASLRLDLTLSLAQQGVVSPFPDTIIAVGRRSAVDVTVAGLVGAHAGVELGVALHVTPHGGLVARVGWDVAPVHGVSWMIGARLDTIPAVVAVTGTLLALVILHAEWDFKWCEPDSTSRFCTGN